MTIDARPSDAIAVAVTCTPPLPIYGNEDVLKRVMEARTTKFSEPRITFIK